MQKILAVGCILLMIVLLGCAKEKSISSDNAFLEMGFQNEMDGEPLKLNFTYFNDFNEDLKISRLKYYISNIHLVSGNTITPIPDSYFLIDEEKEASKIIKATIPPGNYDAVAFLIGVDSTRNVSGAQTGALDPALDMFWTWSTGYIMAKLEGTSSLSTAPNNRIQYHIGGFSGVNNALRYVIAELPPGTSLQRGKTLRVDLAAEVQSWFDGVHEMRIEDHAVIMTPGVAAMQFADNYSSMFSITNVAIK
jgi:hypothetical protein